MAGDYAYDLAARLVESARTTLEATLLNGIGMLPNIIAALVLFIVGWGMGSIFGWLARRILDGIKFEKYLKAHGLEDALGKVQVTGVIVQLVKYFIWLVFLQQAVALLELGTVSSFIGSLLLYAPVVIGAIAVVIAAALFGEWVYEKFIESGKEPYLKTMGKTAKYLIIFLSVVVGLDTLGYDTTMIKYMVLTAAQGVSWGVALAFGIAFGLGGQETAKDFLQSFRKAFHV